MITAPFEYVRAASVDEAVVTGEGLLRGRRVALALCEFTFLAGSIGVAAAERLVAAVERATEEQLPLLAAIVGVHAYQGTRYTVAGEVGRAEGNHHPSIAPYGAFRAADGFLQLSVGSEGLWRRFAPLAGVDADDPMFASNGLRVANRQALVERIEAAFAARPVEHWLAELERAGVPAGRIRTLDQVYDWEQTRSQGLLVETDHATLGRVALPGPPLRFDGSSPAEHRPPPILGQHTAEVLAWLDHLDHLDDLGAADGTGAT